MNEDKYIQSLFEAARNESPRLSFDEVSQNLQTSISGSLSQSTKVWLISTKLNTFLMLCIGICLLASLFLIFSTTEVGMPTQGIKALSDTLNMVHILTAKTMDKPILKGKELVIINKTHSLSNPNKPTLDTIALDPQVFLTTQKPDTNVQVISLDTLNRIPKWEVGKSSIGKEQVITLEKKDHSATVQRASESELSLYINRKDSEADVQEFLNKLKVQGLRVEMKNSFLESNKILDSFSINLTHESGLDFELKGSGFLRFEIILHIDEVGSIQDFKYRFNGEAFTRRVPLNCTGYKTYIYGRGYSGKSGKTSIPID